MARKQAIPIAVRRAVALRDGGDCHYCGRPGRVTWFGSWVAIDHELDHVIPERCGGKATADNIVIACRQCNRSKGTKGVSEWLAGRRPGIRP